jgi:hypothetical protein
LSDPFQLPVAPPSPSAAALPGVQALQTYFFFPFSVDKNFVTAQHPGIFGKHARWFDCFDEWVANTAHCTDDPLVCHLGTWRRAAFYDFGIDSEAYQEMVFFHPFVRRVFFDARDENPDNDEGESLLRVYRMHPPAGERLFYQAQDARGRAASVEITDLRLFLFANGIGILSIGIEALNLTGEQALWINEEMRKVYPSSSRQIREGRVPHRFALTLQTPAGSQLLVEERFENCHMKAFLPPLSKVITSLLYFVDYAAQEYEPVLDERMIVYTYASVNPSTVPSGYAFSEDYQIFLSRLLYVDRAGATYRYEPGFTRRAMAQQMYARWSHYGTWYGFTNYSSIAATIGEFDCGDHQLREGFLISRMFHRRYYLTAVVALFYRATLLDFAERTALVSRRLFNDAEEGKISIGNVQLASGLRSEFLHFANYWFFDELANKQEEQEHFASQMAQYGVAEMKRQIDDEIDKLSVSLHNYYQFRNTESINRLAMLSLILGAGAVATGYFGMNFEREFHQTIFGPSDEGATLYWVAIAFVTLMSLGTIGFGVFVVLSNWSDYRDSLIPGFLRRQKPPPSSLRRGG